MNIYYLILIVIMTGILLIGGIMYLTGKKQDFEGFEECPYKKELMKQGYNFGQMGVNNRNLKNCHDCGDCPFKNVCPYCFDF